MYVYIRTFPRRNKFLFYYTKPKQNGDQENSRGEVPATCFRYVVKTHTHTIHTHLHTIRTVLTERRANLKKSLLHWMQQENQNHIVSIILNRIVSFRNFLFHTTTIVLRYRSATIRYLPGLPTCL